MGGVGKWEKIRKRSINKESWFLVNQSPSIISVSWINPQRNRTSYAGSTVFKSSLLTLAVRTLDADVCKTILFILRSELLWAPVPAAAPALQSSKESSAKDPALGCSSEQGWQKPAEHSHFRNLFLWLQQQQEETNTAPAKFDLFLPPQGQKNLFRGW